MSAVLFTYAFGFGSGAFVGVLLGKWLSRPKKQWSDSYPGGDALRGYVKSEYEGRPAHDGEQPKDGSNG